MMKRAMVLAMVLLSGEALAQTRNGPRQFVEVRHAAVNRLLRQPAATPQRDAQVARILNGLLDLDELAQRALDPFWAQRTPAERQEFITLLRQLIERNYQQNLRQTADFAVAYEPETINESAGTAVVRSTARSRTDARAAPVTLEYRLIRRNNAWLVYDVVTNNSSLLQTYHDSYTRIIRTQGFPALLTRMRSRVAAIQNGTAVTASPTGPSPAP
jgi:phospholipid transport system substrate-binding protein